MSDTAPANKLLAISDHRVANDAPQRNAAAVARRDDASGAGHSPGELVGRDHAAKATRLAIGLWAARLAGLVGVIPELQKGLNTSRQAQTSFGTASLIAGPFQVIVRTGISEPQSHDSLHARRGTKRAPSGASKRRRSDE